MDEATDAGGGPRTSRPLEIHRRRVVTSTQDLAAALLERPVAGDPPAVLAVLAQEQTAGRGRLGRSFRSPSGAALALTVAQRTSLAANARTWVPLAAGLAVIESLGAVLGPAALAGPPRLGLKWPNDVVTAEGGKLGGILVEGRGADGLLVGIGLNLLGPVLLPGGEPVPGAAWLTGPGGILGDEAEEVDALRERLGLALAEAVRAELAALESAHGDGDAAGTRQRYTMTCLTLGGAVRVDPIGSSGTGGSARRWHGTARAVDEHGRLIVDREEGDAVAVDVGDVRHLRPGPGAGTATDAPDGAHQEEQRT